MTIIHTRSSKCFIKQDEKWVELGSLVQSMQDFADSLNHAGESIKECGAATIEFNDLVNTTRKPIKNDWYKKFDKRKF